MTMVLLLRLDVKGSCPKIAKRTSLPSFGRSMCFAVLFVNAIPCDCSNVKNAKSSGDVDWYYNSDSIKKNVDNDADDVIVDDDNGREERDS